MKLITDEDLAWIADMLDVVVACVGQPWRTALERLDGLQPLARALTNEGALSERSGPDARPDSARRVSQKRMTAVLRAIQRVVGRSTHADLAKTCRALVLGRPALDPAERLDRIAAAARALELSTNAVEQLLWVDLPRERPIELPYGRPDELEIAAFANVQLIENALRRAQTARLTIRGDAGPLIRGAARCGLLATALREGESDTQIEIVGPLALFHRTAVYGRALAALVPLLAEVEAFELSIAARGFNGDYAIVLGSPALLPRTTASLGTPPRLLLRLAKELRTHAPDARLTLLPPAIVSDGVYLCPDLEIDGTYVELVGFWTGEYLARKRAAYEAAGLRVLLCVDEQRGCSGEELPPGVVGYTKRVDAAVVVSRSRPSMA